MSGLFTTHRRPVFTTWPHLPKNNLGEYRANGGDSPEYIHRGVIYRFASGESERSITETGDQSAAIHKYKTKSRNRRYLKGARLPGRMKIAKILAHPQASASAQHGRGLSRRGWNIPDQGLEMVAILQRLREEFTVIRGVIHREAKLYTLYDPKKKKSLCAGA